MQTKGLILIVEDEMLIAEHISRILTSAAYTTVCVTNVEAAITIIENQHPLMVLTDIMLLGDQTGIDLGTILHQKHRIPFVYITSYSGSDIINKVKATRPNAYLVKPFKKEDLLVAVDLALYNSSIEEQQDEQYLVVKDGRVTAQIPHDEILWLEAEGNYTLIVSQTLKKRLIRNTITEMQQQLPANDFIRVHRSYVVNRKKISELASAHVLINGEKLPIGRTYKEHLTERFNA